MTTLPRTRPVAPTKALAFVGKRIKLRMTQFEDELMGIVSQYHLDDPNMEAELRAVGRDVRILLPGSVGTFDFKAYRVNFIVDSSGLIERVTMG